MARPVKQRKIVSPYPTVDFLLLDRREPVNGTVSFLLEEFEAVKLIDYEGLNHEQAAKQMNVSRSTITRIYKRARAKIAESLVENRSLKLNSVNIYLSENWLGCNDCECLFNFHQAELPDICPVCKSSNIERILNEQV